eukprot:3803310-Pleurochrysis_carterae.AAC.1
MIVEISRRATGPSPSAFNAEVEADRHRSYHAWEAPTRCIATAVALRVAGRQRGAYFEASYQMICARSSGWPASTMYTARTPL